MRNRAGVKLAKFLESFSPMFTTPAKTILAHREPGRRTLSSVYR
jgi:hypothetical protein